MAARASKPKVSVLVPIYNHDQYLEAAIESALGQEGVDVEIIAVEDCSTDASRNVLISIRDQRLRPVFNAANLGAYGSQAVALRAASHELVAVLNSDDWWHEGKLALQAELMQGNPELAACFCLADDQGSDIFQSPDVPHPLLPALLSENNVRASGVMFRRGSLAFDESLRTSGDWAALLGACRLGSVGLVRLPLVHWRQHPANSYVRSRAVTLEEIRVRRSILSAPERWIQCGPADRVREGLGWCALNLCALYILCGHRRLAMRAAREALRYLPTSRAARRRAALAAMPLWVSRPRLWGEAREDGLSAAEIGALQPVRFGPLDAG